MVITCHYLPDLRSNIYGDFYNEIIVIIVSNAHGYVTLSFVRSDLIMLS
jgi:hypothetical protein